MEYEVEHGTGKNGKVAGYRIGGKTGTADQIDRSVTVSFTCCAPADDPQIMMLLTLSNASDKTGTYRSGGNMAAPVASSIMAEILPYLGIEPTYSADELVGADHTVPNVVGLKRDEAAAKLKEEGFSCRTVGDGETVTDQTPLGGAIVPNNAEIILYLGAGEIHGAVHRAERCGRQRCGGQPQAHRRGAYHVRLRRDRRQLCERARHLPVGDAGHGGRGGHGGARPVQRQLGDGLKTAKESKI